MWESLVLETTEFEQTFVFHVIELTGSINN